MRLLLDLDPAIVPAEKAASSEPAEGGAAKPSDAKRLPAAAAEAKSDAPAKGKSSHWSKARALAQMVTSGLKSLRKLNTLIRYPPGCR